MSDDAVKEDFKDSADRSTRLFDLRFLIGGLFTLYGLMVGGAGLFNSAEDLKKADGIKINLWMGIGMLVLGLFFLAWVFLRPPKPGRRGDEADADAGPPGEGDGSHRA